ncbi:3-isopropylmalate dehydratase small subunit [Pseudocolwellia agarivorans]|mgnify:CR=1 FL=1|uniref:3-isopropylmalate dehydratase small subunit n=1 Tax=Pseudocolwellia agarivorans TaxID=1911682 RepID=UPI0009848A8C|nr:3-isopropylmalate dehydratase small subunit [Pseudocolwellia agarivorans]
MDAFNIEAGKIAPFMAANIDTDVIMPKQFLKGIDRKGLDKGLFFDQRFLLSGEPNPEFVLNKPQWQGAKFLAVGPNFGCGSSREHAVWGLKQLGIRALIGTTFAGIFYDNCQRNGLLVIELDEKSMSELGDKVASGEINDIEIDLPNQNIKLPQNAKINFELDPMRKEALMQGLDAIGSTLQRAEAIKSFEKKHLLDNPWLA